MANGLQQKLHYNFEHVYIPCLATKLLILASRLESNISFTITTTTDLCTSFLLRYSLSHYNVR